MTIYALIEVNDDAMADEDERRTRQMKTRQMKTRQTNTRQTKTLQMKTRQTKTIEGIEGDR